MNYMDKDKASALDKIREAAFKYDRLMPGAVQLDGFDTASDKLTLVIVGGTDNLTTQEFDALSGVEVTSDGISGTQILFAPDSNAQSGKLVLPNVEESFDSDWTATTYTCLLYTSPSPRDS